MPNTHNYRVFIPLMISLLLAGLTAVEAAGTGVGTTNTQDAFSSASRRYVHIAANQYWITFHNGVSPVLAVSSDGSSWTEVNTGNSDNHLFTTPDPVPSDWGALFSGRTLYLAGATSSMAYFEKYQINAAGVVAKDETRTESVGTHGSNNETNLSLTAGGLVRVFWRYDPRIYLFAGNAGETIWSDQYKSGYITQVNSFFPFALPLGTADDPNENLVMIALDDVSEHQIRSMPYTDATNTWGSAELVADDLNLVGSQPYCRQVSAVKTDDGRSHLVYITNNGLIVHKIRSSSVGGTWTTPSSNITGIDTHTRLSLSTDGLALWLFYDKNMQQLFMRHWIANTWGDETVVKSSTTSLQGAITSSEHVVNDQIGLAWTEGLAVPYVVEFAKVNIGTATPTPTPAATLTPLPTETTLPASGLSITNKIVRASRGEMPEFTVHLEKAGHVRIRIYNLNGKQLAALANRDYPAGTHRLTWNITGVGSGTYWILFETPATKTKEKIVITR
ncbi:T9SS type A sorting domain-containing protein [bacterium]|nr:T9SS type A sorting domain-containing protein [bacterium]